MLVSVVPVTGSLLAECLAFDHVAAAGSAERRDELSEAASQDRMSVAVVDGHAVGYSIEAAWFFGVPFLELLYVHPDFRRQGIGARLLTDFEDRPGPRLFTSTNRSNTVMQSLLHRSGWAQCGELAGLDAADPELFYSKDVEPT